MAVWPIIAGMTLGGIGNAIKTRQANRNATERADARNTVLSDTLARNDPLAADSRAQLMSRLSAGFTPQAETDAGAFRNSIMATAGDIDIGDAPVASSAPTAVRSEIAQQMLDALNRGRSEAQSMARIGGRGDFLMREDIANRQLGSNLSINQNLAGGNMSLLPHLQEIADLRATKPPGALGDVFIGVGNALGSWGGQR